MSIDCINVSDAIWKQVSEGGELTEEQLQHIHTCSSCADALAEAQLCIDALNCVKPHPPAPDCRSAVLDRISSRRTRLVPVWAYACIAMVIAVIIGGALLRHDTKQNVPPPVVRLATTPDPAPEKAPPPQPQPKPEPPAHKPDTPQPPKPPVIPGSSYKPHVEPPPPEPETPPAPVPDPPVVDSVTDAPELADAPAQDASSALAYATWPTRNQPTDSYDYSYTVTDPETGEVTTCRVKRDGNSVEVSMESDQVEPETKPEKESKIDETVQYS